MKNAKVFRLNSTRLSERDDLVLLCLPYWFQSLLLDVTERFLWSSVWRDGDTAVQLSESQKEKIEYAIYLLSMEECDMVINVTTGANNQTVGCDCGCGVPGAPGQPMPVPGYPQQPGQPYLCLPSPIGAPENEVPPVPNIPPPDPVTVDPERCRLANYFYWLMLRHMETLRDYVSGLESATTIVLGIIAVLPAAWVARIGGAALLLIANNIVTIRGYIELAQLLFNPAIQWWVDNREEIVCRTYNNMGQSALANYVWDGMLGAMVFAWDDLETEGWLRTFLQFLWKSVFLRESLFGLALNGVVPDTWLGDGSIDCSVCLQPVTEDTNWFFTRVFVNTGTETFENLESDGFTLSGEWSHGTSTDVRVRVCRSIDPEAVLVAPTWSAVAFTITASGSNGNITYGAENNQSVLCNLDDITLTDFAVAIVRSGYPTPAGTYDDVLTVTDENWLAPYILAGRFGYQPPELVITDLTIANWQFYEDAPI